MKRDRDEALRARMDADANAAGDAIAQVIGQLVEQGFDPFAILAGAHAQIVIAMASVLGCDLAAGRLESAAARLRNPPSAADLALARAVPAGSA